GRHTASPRSRYALPAGSLGSCSASCALGVTTRRLCTKWPCIVSVVRGGGGAPAGPPLPRLPPPPAGRRAEGGPPRRSAPPPLRRGAPPPRAPPAPAARTTTLAADRSGSSVKRFARARV